MTREQIECLVKNGKLPEEPVEEPTLTELREKAKIRRIKGYSKMTKEELTNLLKDE